MEKKDFIEIGIQKDWPSKLVVYTDGASRGNPGLSSLGVVFFHENEQDVLYEYAKFLGKNTNNYAEYCAILKALDLAVKNQVKDLTVKSDSKLLVEQLKRNYKVKSETLTPVYLACQKRVSQLETVTFEHVRREKNKRADELANEILDKIQSFYED